MSPHVQVERDEESLQASSCGCSFPDPAGRLASQRLASLGRPCTVPLAFVGYPTVPPLDGTVKLAFSGLGEPPPGCLGHCHAATATRTASTARISMIHRYRAPDEVEAAPEVGPGVVPEGGGEDMDTSGAHRTSRGRKRRGTRQPPPHAPGMPAIGLAGPARCRAPVASMAITAEHRPRAAAPDGRPAARAGQGHEPGVGEFRSLWSPAGPPPRSLPTPVAPLAATAPQQPPAPAATSPGRCRRGGRRAISCTAPGTLLERVRRHALTSC